MRFGFALFTVSLPLSLALVACGGNTTNGANPQPTDDGGTGDDGSPGNDAGSDAGNDASTTYPAPHEPIPLVQTAAGTPLLTAVKIVTVTFQGDPMEARLQQFGDIITTGAWWKEVSSEYCVQKANTPCIGPGSGGGHVVITSAPASSYTDSTSGASEIETFIQAHVSDGTFPAPTDQTLYSIYFPQGVTIHLDGATGCSNGGFGAYHKSASITPRGGGAPVEVAYAIMPRCGGQEATTTVSASHEFIEAATDPQPTKNMSYFMQNQLWGLIGAEVGDLCVDFTGGNDTWRESGFTVQRSWSNKSAKASHNPCVPIPAGEVYFNASPVHGRETVGLSVGQSVTFEVQPFSDGPMPDWTLQAVDFAQFQGGTPSLSFSFDKTTVNNGTKVMLTVKLTRSPAQGYAIYGILSRSGQQLHYWPAMVQAN